MPEQSEKQEPTKKFLFGLKMILEKYGLPNQIPGIELDKAPNLK